MLSTSQASEPGLSPEIYDKIEIPNNEDENEIDEDIFKFDKSNSRLESGFIAQEVEQIDELKHLVYTQNDDYELKSINYVGFIPFNTKVIQELSSQNDELKKRINELEKKLDLFMHRFENQ